MLDTAAEKLALSLRGQLAPALRKDGPTLTTDICMYLSSIFELALWSRKQVNHSEGVRRVALPLTPPICHVVEWVRERCPLLPAAGERDAPPPS